MIIKELLKEILDILEFKYDKDSFIEGFDDMVLKNTTISIFEKLSDKQKNDLTKELGAGNVPQKESFEILSKYVKSDVLQKILAEESSVLLDLFFKEAFVGIDEEKKKKVLALEQSLKA